jgi:hypothetical protein
MAARRLILDPGLRRRLAEAGAERIAGEFSRPRVLAAWRELLHPFGVG